MEPSAPFLPDAVRLALEAGDLAAASRLACTALAQGHAHPLLFDLRARLSEARGGLARALQDLDAAARLDPENADRLAARAHLATRLGRGRDALADLAAVARLRPQDAAAWRDLGMAQIGQGEVAAARTSLTQASALAPQDAQALGQLAVLAARRADWRSAEALAREALARDPAQAAAVRALAEVELRDGRVEAAAERLSGWLSQGGGTDAGRRLARGLLGDVRERQGRYADAYAVYSQGNAETRRRHAQGAGRAALPAVLRRLQVEAEASPRWTAPPATTRGPAERHVFLMGFMRSGTTLLEQSLAAREDVVTLEEQEALGLGVERFLGSPGGLTRLAEADTAIMARCREDYWGRVRAFGVKPEGKVFVDKNPFNGVKLPLIARLFPDARIVFSLRHPADVVISCFKHRFAVNSYTYELLDLDGAARFYDAYMRLVAAYLPRMSAHLLTYRHEDLVDDFEGGMRRICAHIGLDWCARMRDVGARVREGEVSSPSAVQMRDGLSRAGLYGWRRYAEQLAPVLPFLDPWIERFGYDEGPRS